MKLLNIKYIMIAMLITFASCSKEKNVPAVSVDGDGDFVNIGSLYTDADDSYKKADTKVEYGNLVANKWELKWQVNDKVKITRHGTTAQSVNYIVTPTSDPKIATLAVESGKEEDKLRWSKGGSSDIFSIAYPADAVVGTPSNNEVELKYNMKIAITAVKGGEPTEDQDITKANFRMLNFQSVNKNTTDNVNLTSVPATTTLDITIKNTTSEMLSVSRVAISITNTKGYISKDGKVKFKYNSVDKTVSYIPYSDAPSVVSFVVTINNSSGYIDLNPEENIKFKAFIPGIPYKPGDYKIRVNYGTSGKLYTPQTNLTKPVKHPLIINASPGDDSGWIGDLPNDMKVVDMNIPGSYYCLSYTYGTGLPKVQNYGIEDQWQYGIRVFQTPCDYTNSKVVSACRGTGVLGLTNKKGPEITSGLLDKLIQLLDKQPREFAIVINQYTRPYYNNMENFKNVYDNDIKNYVNSKSKYFYTGSFSNNIKIEDLRGKILIIHESNDATIGPILSGWISYDSQTTTAPFTNFTIGGQPTSIASVDEGYFKNLTINQSKELIDNNFAKSGNIWKITDIASHSPNRVYSDYLTGSVDNMANFIASIKYHNNVGIVLLDFIGDRKLEGSNSGGQARDVYGDVLSQIIINKNFK